MFLIVLKWEFSKFLVLMWKFMCIVYIYNEICKNKLYLLYENVEYKVLYYIYCINCICSIIICLLLNLWKY